MNEVYKLIARKNMLEVELANLNSEISNCLFKERQGKQFRHEVDQKMASRAYELSEKARQLHGVVFQFGAYHVYAKGIKMGHVQNLGDRFRACHTRNGILHHTKDFAEYHDAMDYVINEHTATLAS